MERKHDFDTDEICAEKVSDELKRTPRLRAEFVELRSNLGATILYLQECTVR